MNPARTDADKTDRDETNMIGDWAFLRPVGSSPLVPMPPASTLPANLSFTVQMALAALDAPGGAKDTTAGPVWTI